MDIRDIKEPVHYPEGRGLEEIFNLQKVLIDHYVGIEGLPKYPIDINTKKSQILIKDFTGRVIEELGEAWESYMVMAESIFKDLNINLAPHLQNFNEEVSDSIHFWAELMIFSGFEVERVRDWVRSVFLDGLEDDLLYELFSLGENLLLIENKDEHILKGIPSHVTMVINDEELDDEFLQGGRQVSKKRVTRTAELLWEITYHLQIARNTLKNKPWKQTGMMTDENLYEEELKLATFAMFKFFSYVGFDPSSLFHIYFKKNLVNQFRIKSKY